MHLWFRVLAIDQEHKFVSNDAGGYILVRSCRHELGAENSKRDRAKIAAGASGQQTVTRWAMNGDTDAEHVQCISIVG